MLSTLALDQNNAVEYRATPWDERVLHCRTNEILSIRYDAEQNLLRLLGEFEEHCMADHVAFTVSRIDGADFELKNVMRRLGYYLAEVSLRVIKDDVQNYDFFRKVKLEIRLQPPEVENDYKKIREIAQNDFHFGRLMEDHNVPREAARMRFANWVEDLRNQKKEFWVCKKDDEVQGFHIQQVSGDEADMILTGTAEKASMLAAPLWACALNDLRARGVRKARTLISAAHARAVNLYSFFDFKFERSLLGMHKMRSFVGE